MRAISKIGERNDKNSNPATDIITLCQNDDSNEVSIVLAYMRAISKIHEKNDKNSNPVSDIVRLCQVMTHSKSS